jgi:hypothetical protein
MNLSQTTSKSNGLHFGLASPRGPSQGTYTTTNPIVLTAVRSMARHRLIAPCRAVESVVGPLLVFSFMKRSLLYFGFLAFTLYAVAGVPEPLAVSQTTLVSVNGETFYLTRIPFEIA